MRKLILILLILFLSLPVFAEKAPLSELDDPDRPIDLYYTKLYNEYMDKVDKGEIKCNNSTFTQYVRYPLYDFIEKYDKENNLHTF